MNKKFDIFQDQPLDYRKYLFLIISNWYWFVLSVTIALIIAYSINRYSETYFIASTSIIMEEDQSQNDLLRQVSFFRRMKNQVDLKNETAKLKSYRLARRTIDKLDFGITYMGYGNIRERFLYHSAPFEVIIDSAYVPHYGIQLFISKISEDKYRLSYEQGKDGDIIGEFGKEYKDSAFRFTINNTNNQGWSYKYYGFTFNNPNHLANKYRGMVEVISDEKQSGTVLYLSLKTQVAEQAVTYLNHLTTEYILFDIERKNQTSDNTLKFIDEQIKLISKYLTESEKTMLNYKLDNNVIDLSQQGNLAFNRIRDNQQRKIELIFRQKYLEYLQKYLKEKKDLDQVIAPAVADAQESTLTSMISDLSRLYQEKEEIMVDAKTGNPGIVSINKKIDDYVKRISEIIENTIQSNNVALREVENETKRLTIEIRQLPLNEQELLNIERKFDINNKFYNFLLEKRAEAGIQSVSNISSSRVLDEAREDNVLVQAPKKSLNYVIALLIGLLIPIIIIIVIDLLNNTIISREDIDDYTQIPIIGAIGHDHVGTDMPVITKPQSIISEAFRQIRTNLHYILRNENSKVILITSTMSGEGKTFLALNIGSIFAINNKKVLIAGMDLRRPRIQKKFNVDNSKGISTFLIGRELFDNIIFETDIPNLYFAPAGPVPPNPAELMETDMLKSFIEKARQKFDYIILDTPPVALVTDAFLMARFCDATLYVVRQNYTKKEAVMLINQLDKDKKLPNINIVVNDVSITTVLGYQYYYGYGYGYGYGYVYGNKEYYNNYYRDSVAEKENASRLKKLIRWFRHDE